MGESSYSSCSKFDNLTQNVTFIKSKGTYYLHVLAVDNYGISEEFVSNSLTINDKLFLPDGESNFNGIIQHFLMHSNENISEKVHITASPPNCGHKTVSVTQFNDSSCYQTTDAQDSLICFDFKGNRIAPTNYQIKTYDLGVQNPKTWVIEGKSDENSQWENISSESDCTFLNGKNISHIFEIKNLNGKEFRYIRMLQTGPNWGGHYYLTINSFEFYGYLIQKL